MSKLEQLQLKIENDYTAYREQQLELGATVLWNNSFQNAICGEWNCYLDCWFIQAEDIAESGGTEEMVDVLLELNNIFEELVQHTCEYDSVDFLSDSFYWYLEQFVKQYEGVVVC